jgi:hypothetical protein
MNDVTLFAFEDDFVVTLRCIPMAVRFKLDLCGVKVSLRQWSRFTPDDRRDLLLQPCERAADIAAYRTSLIRLIEERGGGEVKPLPDGSTVPWDQAERIPAAVTAFAGSVSVDPPTDAAWSALTPLQRFVLLKLSRDNHDNVNFLPALEEFGLYSGSPSLLARAS